MKKQSPQASPLPQTSPLPQSPAPPAEGKTMDFPEALRAVMQGACITKLEWNNPQIYGVLDINRELLMIHKDDDKFYTWTISFGDMYGEDWISIIPDIN